MYLLEFGWRLFGRGLVSLGRLCLVFIIRLVGVAMTTVLKDVTPVFYYDLGWGTDECLEVFFHTSHLTIFNIES